MTSFEKSMPPVIEVQCGVKGCPEQIPVMPGSIKSLTLCGLRATLTVDVSSTESRWCERDDCATAFAAATTDDTRTVELLKQYVPDERITEVDTSVTVLRAR